MWWLMLGLWVFAVFVLPMLDEISFDEWVGWVVVVTIIIGLSGLITVAVT